MGLVASTGGRGVGAGNMRAVSAREEGMLFLYLRWMLVLSGGSLSKMTVLGIVELGCPNPLS